MTATEISCCAPGGVMLSDDEATQKSRMFKALGDPVRLKLLSLIASSPDREACICDLMEPVGLSQGTVSHHMKLLTEAGFVSREQRGKWAFFSIEDNGFDDAVAALGF